MSVRAALLLLLAGAAAAATTAKSPKEAVVEKVDAFQNVVVKPGDTLWGIAHTYLKDPARWDEILKHNRLPTSDPTVALPGMVLRVPVRLIKMGLRAAHLVYAVNRVLYRRKETAEWRKSKSEMELFQGDSLRTLEDSRARVKFLNKELLSLEPNSMAVIKPVDEDTDVLLKSGSVFAGRARVITSNARITPRTKDTRYAASVEADLTTRVEVFKGAARVEAQGNRVDVPAGMETSVRPGLAPEVPRRLRNLPELEARAGEFASAEAVGGGAAPNPRTLDAPPVADVDASTLRGDIDSLHVGTPILGFHVQASKDRTFATTVFDRQYDSEERFSPADAGLPPGAYWWRIAIVDLLGVEAQFSEPRYYTVGVRHADRPVDSDLARLLTLTSPAEGAMIDKDNVIVAGVLRDDRLRVEVNGRAARIDADGNFSANVRLVTGVNEILVRIYDGKGNDARLSRRVTRR
ncbi:MAG: LysM peptidoglycan-binding domain-containing protein [Elusimicrobia bacterium]|nr:LysM peptidoglycan-binding domain-containing protein [Elusimicrobiota bacterium]